ncbi:hypothetical protein [Erythrobacter donghaensis]|jgi:hypothetical protein|nr:hypothetical protein [Erythrobacter donghaensis]
MEAFIAALDLKALSTLTERIGLESYRKSTGRGPDHRGGRAAG